MLGKDGISSSQRLILVGEAMHGIFLLQERLELELYCTIGEEERFPWLFARGMG